VYRDTPGEGRYTLEPTVWKDACEEAYYKLLFNKFWNESRGECDDQGTDKQVNVVDEGER
jgi:hypothetical protein